MINKLLSKKINGEQLYLITFSIYLFFAFLRNSTFNPFIGSRIFNLVSYLVFAILVFKIFFFDNYNLKCLVIILICLLISLVSWRMSSSNLIIVMTAFILAARNVSFREIIKWYFIINLIFLLMVILFALFGVIQNLVYTVKGRQDRYSLGISYPTDLASHVLYLILANAYINFNKLNWHYYFSYFLIAMILKIITDARLSIICILLTIPVLYIAQKAQLGNKVARIFTSFFWIITPISAAITFFSTYFFDNRNKIFYFIDHLLSGRLSYGKTALNLYPIKMFGQKIIEQGFGGNFGKMLSNSGSYGYFYIDSSYMRLILIYGFLVFIVFISMMIFISIRETLKGNYILPAILLIITISCIVEQHLLELTYNPFLLVLLSTQKDNLFKGSFFKNGRK